MCLTVQDSKGFFLQWWINNHRVFGLWPLSCILQTRKHNILEAESVSILSWGRNIYSVKSLIKSSHRSPNNIWKVTLWPTVSRTVRLGVRHPSGAHDQFFFLLEIFFRQLRVCYSVAPSLTRGRVCNLLFLLVLASLAGTLGLPSLTRGRVCLLSVFYQYQSIVSQYVRKIFTLSVFDTVQECIYNIYEASFSPGSVQQIMPQLLVAYTTTTV
jgi:hypothetical protein